MGKGIELTFTANAKQLLRTTDNVDEAFNAVADSLDGISDESAKSASIMSKEFDGASRDVKRNAGDLERSFKDVANTIGESSARGGRDLARNTKEGTDKAKDSLSELKDEAKSNISESASSFDGTLGSLVDTVQGTLGGVIAALPPQFAVAAGLAAVGLGVITAEFEKIEERKQQDKEDTAELAAEYIELGRSGTRSVEAISAELKTMATSIDDNDVKLKDIKKTADQLGIPFESLAQAYAGNSELLEEQLANVRELYKAQIEVDNAANKGASSYGQNVSANQIALSQQIGLLVEAKTKADDAAAAQKLYAESGAAEIAHKAEVIKTVNDAYDEQASKLENFISKETGLFDTGKYVKAMERRSKALRDYQKDLAASELSPEAKAFLNDQGADAAAQYLAGYQKAGPKTKKALNDIWSEAGREDSGAYTAEVEEGFKKKPLDPPKITPPKIDVKELLRNTQRELTAAPLKITVDVVGRDGKKIK